MSFKLLQCCTEPPTGVQVSEGQRRTIRRMRRRVSQANTKNGNKQKKSDPNIPAGLSKMVRKHEQEKQLEPYQVELLKLQRHLEEHDRRMIVALRGPRCRGQGRHHPTCHPLHEREALPRRRPGQADRGAAQPVVSAALRRAVPTRWRDGSVRPQLVQPGHGRAGLRLLHREGARRLPPRRGRLREGPRSPGHDCW